MEDRIHKIEEVVDGCSLLLEYITICMDEGIISVKKAGVWTKKSHRRQVYGYGVAEGRPRQSQQAPFGSKGKGGQKPLQSGDVRLLRSPVRTEVIRVHGGGIRLELGYDSHRPPTGGSAPPNTNNTNNVWNVNSNGNYNNNNASNSNGIRPALMESEISKPFDGSNTVHHHQRESYPVARLCMDGR